VEAASSFTIDFSQDGTDVVAAGSGDINLTGLSYYQNYTSGLSNIDPSIGYVVLSSNSSAPVSGYNGFTGPSSFGTGGTSYASSTTAGGSSLGIYASGGYADIYVPSGYSSDRALAESATWDNTTLSGLGLTPGTYTWTWDGGENSFNIDVIAPVSVPEPSQYGLFFVLAVAGFIACRRLSARSARTA
jgi:hypothetical protein